MAIHLLDYGLGRRHRYRGCRLSCVTQLDNGLVPDRQSVILRCVRYAAEHQWRYGGRRHRRGTRCGETDPADRCAPGVLADRQRSPVGHLVTSIARRNSMPAARQGPAQPTACCRKPRRSTPCSRQRRATACTSSRSRAPDSLLLEVFTNEGTGTLVVDDIADALYAGRTGVGGVDSMTRLWDKGLPLDRAACSGTRPGEDHLDSTHDWSRYDIRGSIAHAEMLAATGPAERRGLRCTSATGLRQGSRRRIRCRWRLAASRLEDEDVAYRDRESRLTSVDRRAAGGTIAPRAFAERSGADRTCVSICSHPLPRSRRWPIEFDMLEQLAAKR